MSVQRGKDLLLKIENGGSYTTIAGLRARSISFGAEPVDITHTESAGQWRELLSGSGVKRASVSGSGLFRDGASDELVRQHVFDGTIPNWQIVIPDFGTVSGAFQITGFDLSGRHDGEVTFEMSLESAGQLIFVAA